MLGVGASVYGLAVDVAVGAAAGEDPVVGVAVPDGLAVAVGRGFSGGNFSNTYGGSSLGLAEADGVAVGAGAVAVGAAATGAAVPVGVAVGFGFENTGNPSLGVKAASFSFTTVLAVSGRVVRAYLERVAVAVAVGAAFWAGVTKKVASYVGAGAAAVAVPVALAVPEAAAEADAGAVAANLTAGRD
jgi:hypothetical protein